MNRLVRKFPLPILFLIFAAAAIPAFAQASGAPEPNYEVVLHLVHGSDGGQSEKLPKRLSDISKQLRDEFPYTSYRVSDTYVGRIGKNGAFHYKSISDIFGQPAGGPPSFLEWSIVASRTASGPQDMLQMQAFRFGARIPVQTGGPAPETGKPMQFVNYEQVGINMDGTGMRIGTPTLIGTLSLPKTSGTIFLVLTVSPVES